MTRLFYDIETNDRLESYTTVHCIVTRDLDTDEVQCYHQDPCISPRAGGLGDAWRVLERANLRVAHNGQRFDEVVLEEGGKFPVSDEESSSIWNPRGIFRDSIVLSHMVWPEIRSADTALRKIRAKNGGPEFPTDCVGRHSLKAWGHRFKEYKGEFSEFEIFTQEMLDYCIQDTKVGALLYNRAVKSLEQRNVPESTVQTEHEFSEVLSRMMRFGCDFDLNKAHILSDKLVAELAKLDDDLSGKFEPWVKRWTTKVKKLKREKIIPINFNSRQQIGRLYTERHGWRPEPDRIGKDGHPTVDEATFKELMLLGLPHAETIAKRFVIKARLAMLAVAANKTSKPWIECVEDDGKIRPYVNHNGTVTSRCSHAFPNVTLTPRVDKLYGPEFRELWTVPKGWYMLGCDAKGLELRIMAHYLAPYDGGAYAKIVVDGDPHGRHQELLGFTDHASMRGRDRGKTWTYAKLYGAGLAKLGYIEVEGIRHITKRQAEKLGKAAVIRFEQGLVGMEQLKAELFVHLTGFADPPYRAVLLNPYARSLLGAWLPCRSTHSAINLIFQGGGAAVMKLAVILADRYMQESGAVWGEHYSQTIFAHDEYQYAVHPEWVEKAKDAMARGIVDAGLKLKLSVPMEADVKQGRNWKDTH